MEGGGGGFVRGGNQRRKKKNFRGSFPTIFFPLFCIKYKTPLSFPSIVWYFFSFFLIDYSVAFGCSFSCFISILSTRHRRLSSVSWRTSYTTITCLITYKSTGTEAISCLSDRIGSGENKKRKLFHNTRKEGWPSSLHLIFIYTIDVRIESTASLQQRIMKEFPSLLSRWTNEWPVGLASRRSQGGKKND
jgi:hypothetical protein